jgi:hypothetical protein
MGRGRDAGGTQAAELVGGRKVGSTGLDTRSAEGMLYAGALRRCLTQVPYAGALRRCLTLVPYAGALRRCLRHNSVTT